jgi:hypothetical protein
MTTFTTNTVLNARGRRILETRREAETRAWRLIDPLLSLFTRRPADPAEAVARAERRETARRAVDNLLR